MTITVARRVPRFATEAEEADWWYDNREEHAKDWIEAARSAPPGERIRLRYLLEDSTEEKNDPE